LTVKISEANLYISKTKFFQMSVFVRLKMDGHEEKKTSSQSGQNPKWENETFVFNNIARKSQMEFSVYHKSLFSNEELIGNAIFIF
jgi:C2 domain